MDIIFVLAKWYKDLFDGMFAKIGFNAETPEGIIVIAVAVIGLHLAGQFFAGLAEKFDD